LTMAGEPTVSMKDESTETATGIERSPARPLLLFLICGLSIAGTVVIGNILVQLLALVSLTVVFLLAFAFVRKRKPFEYLREVFFAFFVFALVAIISGVIGGVANLAAGQALGFVADAVTVILLITVITKLSGRSLSSLYLQRGNLRLGLRVGLAAFLVFTLSIIVGFQVIFGGSKGVTFDRILSVMPLVLIAAFLNAPKEELWFRGLFFRRYEPLLGRRRSNLVQAPIFALAHFTPQYEQFGPVFFVSFIAIVFALGLGWGYLMQKTDSVLASTLAHAGADVGIYLPLFLSLL
jgi:membrane protease YdiL (CAAX protease family)